MVRGQGMLAFTLLLAAAPLAVPACSAGPASSAGPVSAGGAGPGGSPGSASAAAPAAPKEVSFADCPSIGGSTTPGPASSGAARKSDLADVFQGNRDKFRCCYDAARRIKPELRGKYAVAVTLNPDGTIKAIRSDTDASEIKDDAMGDCVFTVAKSLKFPTHAEGKESQITYPFEFTPRGNHR